MVDRGRGRIELGSSPIAPMWRKRQIQQYIMARKENPISVRLYLNRSSDWLVGRKKFWSKKLDFFLNVLWSLLKRTKYSVSSFYFKKKDWFLFFVKLGYLTCFFFVFSLAYSRIFPTIEEDNYTRAFQVLLQLSLFLLNFRLFTTKEEKEAKWLLLILAFYSVVATLFLKNLVSLEGLLFIVVPLFCFFLLRLPSDVLPFAILLFYSLEKGLAQWAFFLLFQLIAYYSLCFFLEDRPKQSICPFLILLIYLFVLGKVHYSADFLHEPARLTALVSGACIIFLCFRRRGKVSFLFAFLISFFSSTGIGVIAIASAPGGDNISCPIPFLFLFCHLFLGFIPFSKEYPGGKTTSSPLTLWGIVVFSTLLSKPGMARGVDRGTRLLSSLIRISSLRLRRRKWMTRRKKFLRLFLFFIHWVRGIHFFKAGGIQLLE